MACIALSHNYIFFSLFKMGRWSGSIGFFSGWLHWAVCGWLVWFGLVWLSGWLVLLSLSVHYQWCCSCRNENSATASVEAHAIHKVLQFRAEDCGASTNVFLRCPSSKQHPNPLTHICMVHT